MASSFNARGHPPPDLIGIDAPTLLQVESELSGKEVADPLRFVDLIERGFNLRAKLVRQGSTVGRHAQAHRRTGPYGGATVEQRPVSSVGSPHG